MNYLQPQTKLWRWMFIAIVTLVQGCEFSISHASVSSSQTHTETFFQTPWRGEGQQYLSYGVFKDDLLDAVAAAKERIVFVTLAFDDAELASALYAAKARGVFVATLIDSEESKAARGAGSVFEQFARRNLLLLSGSVAKLPMEGLSTLVFDSSVWRLSARLDEKSAASVRIDRSPYTFDEVLEWVKRPRSEGKETSKLQQKKEKGAKTPTRPNAPGIKIFGTMKSEGEAKAEPLKSIPKKLPRETRLQRLQRGRSSVPEQDGSTGSTHRPAESSREEDLGNE